VPVDTTGKQVETKLDADHSTFGLQAGAEFEMTDNFTLFGKYQVMTHDHLMEIFDTSTIEHINIQSLQGGVRYEF
jgi:opacity protein-like surface antigen